MKNKMESGFIYILKNKSFKDHYLKIGMTTRQPDARVKEISRATGVAEPFDLVFAHQVADCKIAEKEIHKTLSSYRNQKKKEFFIIPFNLAKLIVRQVCEKINKNFNLFIQEPIIIENPLPNNLENDFDDPLGVVSININQIISSPSGTSILNNIQKQRIKIIAEILREVFPSSYEEWIIDFSRDSCPEEEIKIWEYIAKAFLKFENQFVSQEEKKEAFNLLLMRSMESPSRIIQKFQPQYITKKVVKEILYGYELSPKPLLVKRIDN